MNIENSETVRVDKVEGQILPGPRREVTLGKYVFEIENKFSVSYCYTESKLTFGRPTDAESFKIYGVTYL